jgi:cytoskeletal protein CcmA (bactofilin family)
MLGRKNKGRKGQTTTIIANGTRIEGRMVADKEVLVEGYVEGSIQSDSSVTVGPAGLVRGDVRATDVTVGGRVEGTVSAAGSLHMLEGGCVAGDAVYGVLEVDRGGEILGRTTKLGQEAFAEEVRTEELSALDTGSAVLSERPGPPPAPEGGRRQKTSTQPGISRPTPPPPPIPPVLQADPETGTDD